MTTGPAAPTAGSCWHGTRQDSWWKLLYPDPAGSRWRALCMKAPDHYQWVQPGEQRWILDRLFGVELLPLVGQVDEPDGDDRADGEDLAPAGVVPGLLPQTGMPGVGTVVAPPPPPPGGATPGLSDTANTTALATDAELVRVRVTPVASANAAPES